jgi:hypothetical protein
VLVDSDSFHVLIGSQDRCQAATNGFQWMCGRAGVTFLAVCVGNSHAARVRSTDRQVMTAPPPTVLPRLEP